jgi:hypothetical protein
VYLLITSKLRTLKQNSAVGGGKNVKRMNSFGPMFFCSNQGNMGGGGGITGGTLNSHFTIKYTHKNLLYIKVVYKFRN